MSSDSESDSEVLIQTPQCSCSCSWGPEEIPEKLRAAGLSNKEWHDVRDIMSNTRWAYGFCGFLLTLAVLIISKILLAQFAHVALPSWLVGALAVFGVTVFILVGMKHAAAEVNEKILEDKGMELEGQRIFIRETSFAAAGAKV
mmetsp:Transcript_6888/g.12183  ORF Transcript_6888/g.12183 Transcript_6888/m.12183 type:complete len:144 (-) Transcript_6888:67-498(-)